MFFSDIRPGADAQVRLVLLLACFPKLGNRHRPRSIGVSRVTESLSPTLRVDDDRSRGGIRDGMRDENLEALCGVRQSCRPYREYAARGCT